MKNDIRDYLEKQAAWQRSRKKKSWKQKLAESSEMRRSLKSLKKAN
jgi:hypothetical protein